MSGLLPNTFLSILIPSATALFALIVVFSVLILSYKFITKLSGAVNKSVRDEEKKIVDSAYEEAAEIMEGAKKESLRILEEANARASETITDTTTLSEDASENLKNKIDELSRQQAKTIENSSDEIIGIYRQAVEQQKQETLTTLSNATKTVEQEIMSKVDEFGKTLEEGTVESEKAVQQRIEEKYRQIESELEQYKSEKLRKIDDSIYSLVIQVSRVVLGQAIDAEKHQELIINSLNKAKKELDVKVEISQDTTNEQQNS